MYPSLPVKNNTAVGTVKDSSINKHKLYGYYWYKFHLQSHFQLISKEITRVVMSEDVLDTPPQIEIKIEEDEEHQQTSPS